MIYTLDNFWGQFLLELVWRDIDLKKLTFIIVMVHILTIATDYEYRFSVQ